MKTEILAPAGGERSAYAALLAGADAVYLGLTQFSARSGAENFDEAALARVTEYAHLLGAKVYVCLNTLVKDSETAEFFERARRAKNAGADALIMQDMFLGRTLKEVYPEISLHLSTQAGCCNAYGAYLAKEYGFSRVVLARETPLSETKKISEIIETEAFVQGALCTAFSGQCYFSSFAGNNSGNRGRCKQPCRKRYALDRAGYETLSYALSPSDLCVGERVKEYLAAGVTSLKIEGRMRREEYVASATAYYRALLAGAAAEEEFSRLKRAYNRGDYTRGLAFGQKEDFLSRNVQGHIGEDVGEISLRGGRYFCKSASVFKKGDGFKILRAGREVGGAQFIERGEGGFYLASAQKLRAGDRVRVTTDTAAGEKSLSVRAPREITVKVRLVAGEIARAEGAGFTLTGELVPAAKNAPLAAQEVVSCFQKTDTLPLSPAVEVQTEGAFLPKSALNAFRRAFYEGVKKTLAPAPAPIKKREIPACEITPEKGNLRAVIGERRKADIVIYKPRDYKNITPEAGAWLYLPPFFTEEDEKLVAPVLKEFEGIYCDGYYALALAEKYGMKLFAGTGFNLTNRYAVRAVKERATYFALSKEISAKEQDALASAGAFALTEGGIKVMDLCYCLFGKTCRDCDKREQYRLTDEEGRSFPLRRYEMAEGCRFEVYNCAYLASQKGLASVLQDGSVSLSAAQRTRGHETRSML